MEPAHRGIAEGERQRKAGVEVLGKAGVIGGSERQGAAQALAARRDAERALGRDVDRIGPPRLDPLGDPPARPQRQADLRIGRARQRPELVGRDHLDLVAERLAFASDPLQRAHDAIDLRRPGVAHQEDAHQAATPHPPPHGDAGRSGHQVEAALPRPVDQLEAAVPVLDQRRAALDPVAVVAVLDAFDGADLRLVHVAADHAATRRGGAPRAASERS